MGCSRFAMTAVAITVTTFDAIRIASADIEREVVAQSACTTRSGDERHRPDDRPADGAGACRHHLTNRRGCNEADQRRREARTAKPLRARSPEPPSDYVGTATERSIEYQDEAASGYVRPGGDELARRRVEPVGIAGRRPVARSREQWAGSARSPPARPARGAILSTARTATLRLNAAVAHARNASDRQRQARQ